MSAQVEEVPSLDSLVTKAKTLFKEKFGREATHGGAAPGRVNLIGEHTDYNMGLVFPMALPLVTVVVGAISDTENVTVYSQSQNSSISFPATETEKPEQGSTSWANYVKGVAHHFHAQPLPPLDAVIIGSVPLGGGVSSSASVEVAFYTFLEQLTGSRAKSDQEKALACQGAEHSHAGMPCGIMDQFISVMGKQGTALLIDCRELTARSVPLSDPSMAVLITNSNVKHQLTGSEYPERRAACLDSARAMDKTSLREVDMDTVNSHRDKFDDVTYRRVKHVVTEIARTNAAAEALESGDLVAMGKLMVESHVSLRDDFEVSCPELDVLVEAALKVNGVYGSRMTGGGFGGCTVTLLKQEAVQAVLESIEKEYQGKATFYLCSPSDGARPISI